MYRSTLHSNEAIPQEYRKQAENLFPKKGFSPNTGPSSKAAAEFANALGIGTEYKRLLGLPWATNGDGKPEGKIEGKIDDYLENFQYNLDLLIQKTWVEKAEQTRKEKLQDQVPGFVAGIEKGNYQQALEEFGIILDELAYLFFGTQSTREDFAEYTFRIDPQMGLFWWYGSQLGRLKEAMKTNQTDNESLWSLLLIGICYLTNF